MKKIINTVKQSGKIQLITLLIVGLFFLTAGYFLMVPNFVQAGALTSVKDVLSTSAPATDSNHTIYFTFSTGVTWDAGDTITLTFETGFDLADLGVDEPEDFDITTDAGGTPVEETIVADGGSCDTDVIEVSTISSQVITFTACSAYTAPPTASDIEIEIGTNATGGDDQIQNPGKSAGTGTADIRSIDINGTIGDTGTAYVAIIEGVTVSVTVAESLAFSITGLAAGSCTGDTGSPAPVVKDFSGANNTAPFGTIINTDKFYVGCQQLEVSSNASGGYAVTAQEDTSLHSTTTETLLDDTQCDNSLCDEDTSDTWADPTKNGFGFTCEDNSGTDCITDLNQFTEYRTFACIGADADCDPGTGLKAPQTVMSNAGTVSANQSIIHYKLSVDSAQSTGETYDNTVTYIATATF
jgi:hypothetical protein